MPWMLRHASKLSVPGSSKARSRDEARAEVGPLDEKISGSPYRKRSGLFRGGLISFSLGDMPSRLLFAIDRSLGAFFRNMVDPETLLEGEGSGFRC